MRLWGKVMSGSLLVFAAVFVGVGLFVPEAMPLRAIAEGFGSRMT